MLRDRALSGRDGIRLSPSSALARQDRVSAVAARVLRPARCAAEDACVREVRALPEQILARGRDDDGECAKRQKHRAALERLSVPGRAERWQLPSATLARCPVTRDAMRVLSRRAMRPGALAGVADRMN